MIKEALQYFLEKTRTSIHHINGVMYHEKSNGDLIPILSEHPPTVLKIGTLTGLIDFFKRCEKDGMDVNESFYVRVDSAKKIVVFEREVNELNQNEIASIVDCTDFTARNTSDLTHMDSEQATIALLSSFKQCETASLLLQVIASTSVSNESSFEDDGITQSATVGKAIKSKVKVKNPVMLYPNATFPELLVNPMPYIFRMSKTRSDETTFSLHRGDCSEWNYKTMQDIKQYIQERSNVEVFV